MTTGTAFLSGFIHAVVLTLLWQSIHEVGYWAAWPRRAATAAVLAIVWSAGYFAHLFLREP